MTSFPRAVHNLRKTSVLLQYIYILYTTQAHFIKHSINDGPVNGNTAAVVRMCVSVHHNTTLAIKQYIIQYVT